MVTDAGVSILAGAAPPGSMNAVIATETIGGGWPAGVRAGLGAMAADALFALLALAGAVTVVERLPTLRAAMVTAGGALMLYFALGAARSVEATLAETQPASDTRRGFTKAFVLALTNPYQVLFWLTVGIGLLDSGRLDVLARLPVVGDTLAGTVVVQTGSPALFVGLFGGIAVWVVGFPAALVATRRRVDAAAPLVAGASAVVLAGFGLLFLWNGLTAIV